MAAYLMFVRSEPHPGERENFNTWYEEQHIPDLLRVPGIKSAKRYEILSDTPGWKDTFLGIYEIEADETADITNEIARRYGTDEMPRNPKSVDSSKSVVIWAKPISAR